MLSDKIRAHSEEKEDITKSLEEFVSRLPKKYSFGYTIDEWDVSRNELTLRSHPHYYITYPLELVDASTDELMAYFVELEKEAERRLEEERAGAEKRREKERKEAEQRIEESEKAQLARLLTKYSWKDV